MKLDIRPLLAGDRLLKFDYELPLEIDSCDSASFLYGVGFPSPLKVRGEITNTAGYMRMSLTMSVDYQTACARCLKPVEGTFTLDLEKTVVTSDMLGGDNEDDRDDYAIVENGFLDMDEPLIEQIEMEFPVRFLCDEDCKGLCPKCGCNLNDEKCQCEAKDIDPRLEPLKKLLEQMKNEDNNN